MVEIKTIEERKQSLLKKGKENGYVTYEELASELKGLEVDSDTLEDIFCGLEIDASLEPQVGWFAFSDGIFAPRPDVYPNLLGIIEWLNPCATAKEGERGIILIPKSSAKIVAFCIIFKDFSLIFSSARLGIV